MGNLWVANPGLFGRQYRGKRGIKSIRTRRKGSARKRRKRKNKMEKIRGSASEDSPKV